MSTNKLTSEYILALDVDALMKLLEFKRMSKRDLAIKLGRSENTVYSYFTNPEHIRLDQVVDIATALSGPKTVDPMELIKSTVRKTGP